MINVRTIAVRGSHPGCGKDTVAEMLQKKLYKEGFFFTPAKFATALRNVVFKRTGIPNEVSETVAGKNLVLPCGKTVGQTLVSEGAILREALGPNVFVHALFDRLEENEPVIISDLRFRNENAAVKKRAGVTVLVRSNRLVNPEQLAGRSLNEACEVDLNGVEADYVVENDGSYDELERKVDDLVRKLLADT